MRNQSVLLKKLRKKTAFQLIKTSREGVDFNTFDGLTRNIPLSSADWSHILQISERTIQRYKKENKKFDSIYTERILMVMLIFEKGIEVFDDLDKFMTWLGSQNVSLGGVKPIDLLDSSFGIKIVEEALIRIEYGVLA